MADNNLELLVLLQPPPKCWDICTAIAYWKLSFEWPFLYVTPSSHPSWEDKGRQCLLFVLYTHPILPTQPWPHPHVVCMCPSLLRLHLKNGTPRVSACVSPPLVRSSLVLKLLEEPWVLSSTFPLSSVVTQSMLTVAAATTTLFSIRLQAYAFGYFNPLPQFLYFCGYMLVSEPQ